jgi:hypothetical protein
LRRVALSEVRVVREIEQGVPEHNPCTVMCIRGNLEAAGQDPSTATVVIIATHNTPHTAHYTPSKDPSGLDKSPYNVFF